MPSNYTFDSLRIELLRRLGGRSDTVSATRAGEFLNSAQLKLAEANFAIPAFEEVVLLSLVADQPELNLLMVTPQFVLDSVFAQNPGGATPPISTVTPYVNNLQNLLGIRVVQRKPAASDTSGDTGWRMPRMSWVEWREIERTQATGKPIRWARNGYRFVVDPKPDAEYVLQVDYRRRPQLDMLEVEGEWQEVLLNLGCWIGWQAYGEPGLANSSREMLPVNVRAILEVPLDAANWDAQWDDELGMQPRMGY